MVSKSSSAMKAVGRVASLETHAVVAPRVTVADADVESNCIEGAADDGARTLKRVPSDRALLFGCQTTNVRDCAVVNEPRSTTWWISVGERTLAGGSGINVRVVTVLPGLKPLPLMTSITREPAGASDGVIDVI